MTENRRHSVGTLCLLPRLRPDHPAGAGAVLDDDGLAQEGGHRLGDQPGPDVGSAARGRGTTILIGRLG
jgi:hypothetical protein